MARGGARGMCVRPGVRGRGPGREVPGVWPDSAGEQRRAALAPGRYAGREPKRALASSSIGVAMRKSWNSASPS